MAGISSVCTKDRLIRSNYYSDTYRAEFSMNGVTQEWDVQHISIPFPKLKEIEFKTRFNISDEEMPEYYAHLKNNVKHSIKMVNKLKAINDEAVNRATFYFVKSHASAKENVQGYDIYIISEPSDLLVGSPIISDNGANLHMILNLGIRLVQNGKVYNDRGFSVGTIDLDSMNVVQADGKMLIKDSFFLFSSDGEEYPDAVTKDAYAFLPEDVITGKRNVSADSDIYAICSLLWTLLDGKHYTEKPDLSHVPRYAPNEKLIELLRAGMTDGAVARKDLNKVLFSTIKESQDGYIKFATPSYAPRVLKAVEEYKQYSNVDENDAQDQDYYDESSDDEETDEFSEEDNEIFIDRMSKRQKILSVSAAAMLSLFIIGGAFAGGKIMGEKGWGVSVRTVAEAEAVEEVEQETENIEQVVFTPAPISTSKPITDSEIPVLNFDTDYSWFRSEFNADEFCAVVFTDSFAIKQEIIEAWNFYISDNDIQCYVFARPEGTTDIRCNSKCGDKVLVIAGNGAGAMNVKMTQTELAQYFTYKFTYGTLNGLSCLRSTGSTPFVEPKPTPAPAQEPTVNVLEENPDPDGDGNNSAIDYTGNTAAENQYSQYNQGETYYNSGYSENYSGGQAVTEYTQQTEVTNTVTQAQEWGDSGYTVREFSITASNNTVRVGQTITVRVSGATTSMLEAGTSDANIATITSYQDANGFFIVTGRLPGVVLIEITDPNIGTASVQIEVIN